MKTMRQFSTVMCVIILSAVMSMAAFAGSWQGSNASGWRWQEDTGAYARDGWRWIDADGDGIARSYYFNADGYCQMGPGSTPDGYTVDENGAWVQNGVVMEKKLSTGEVYQAGQSSDQNKNVGLIAMSTNLSDYNGFYEGISAILSGVAFPLTGSGLTINGNSITITYEDSDTPTVYSFNNPGSMDDNGTVKWSCTNNPSSYLQGVKGRDSETGTVETVFALVTTYKEDGRLGINYLIQTYGKKE